jgi:crossover junction endodeoxyribonuclease RuvC
VRLFVGIDVGLDGAVAFLPEEGKAVVFDIPTLSVGKRREYDVGACAGLLRAPLAPEFSIAVGIERATAMPKQGVVSTFSFGKGFGMWLGICAALRLPFEVVSPKRWQGVMIPGEKSKDASRLVASRLFPEVDLSKKKHHGRADALLIAAYLRMTHTGVKRWRS